jgi:hypothetical protein
MANPSPDSYEDNVFINCPFDRQYKATFYAIVFAIHDAGFIARCALEEIDSGQARLNKILEIISECKYGVHDISRTEMGRGNLPRFNMPFECGLFWGCQRFGDNRHNDKRILVLDKDDHRYRSSLSDLAGQDVQSHRGNPRLAVDRIRTWLYSTSGRKTIPGGKAIWEHYKLFRAEMSAMLNQVGITQAEINRPEYYADYVAFIVEWLTQREEKARAELTANRTRDLITVTI